MSEIINNLLENLERNRNALDGYIVEMEGMLSDVKNVLTGNGMKNFNNRYLLDEKLKTTTEFIKTLSSLRKQHDQNVLDEINIRMKVDKENSGADGKLGGKVTKEMLDAIHKQVTGEDDGFIDDDSETGDDETE